MTYLSKIESHLARLMSAVVDPHNPMWPSVLDVRTGRYPDGDHIPKRVYRLIGAPRGSTLYWDQPLVVAAHALSELIGVPAYAQAADAYVRSFLDRCVAPTGMFQWGNHQYYDLFDRKIVSFSGGHHELRPITPAWDIFWRHEAEQTATYVRTMGLRHVYNPTTGGFNRHDDGNKGHAFLEAGGILCESLAWLHGKTGDQELRNQALRIARYSYQHRGQSTGLMKNEPDMGRWDSKVATSEVGLWAQSLLRAGSHTSNDEFIEMAGNAIRAYLENAYDNESGRYFGQVSVESGDPVIPNEAGYWPRKYSDPWNTDQWPTHDYPMAVAEASLSLYGLTREQLFLNAVQRWARIAADGRPALTGQWAYAENYGRCLHFLVRAGRELGDDRLLSVAATIAEESAAALYENDMFQGYPGGHVYESVDGVGCLFLALMSLETGRESIWHGFGF